MWENNRAEPLVRYYPKIIEFLGYDPSPESLTLADRIVWVRRRLGLTQEQFAAKLGVDAKTVWRWENGEHEPDRDCDRRLRRIFEKCEGVG